MSVEITNASKAIRQLIGRLANDNRIERFQGLLINSNSSVMVTDRWRSQYYERVEDLEDRLGEIKQPQTPLDDSENPS